MPGLALPGGPSLSGAWPCCVWNRQLVHCTGEEDVTVATHTGMWLCQKA